MDNSVLTKDDMDAKMRFVSQYKVSRRRGDQQERQGGFSHFSRCHLDIQKIYQNNYFGPYDPPGIEVDPMVAPSRRTNFSFFDLDATAVRLNAVFQSSPLECG